MTLATESDPAVPMKTYEVIESAYAFSISSEIAIITVEQFESVAANLKDVKNRLSLIEAERVKITQPLNDSLRATNALFRKASEHLTLQESYAKRAIIAYNDEQDRREKELQRQADEAARKEREKLAARAAAAEDKGKPEKAAQLEQRAEAVVAPVVTLQRPVNTGIGDRKVWKFRIKDAALVPREYLTVNEVAIGGVVRALKGSTNIPGVETYQESVIAVRR
jgi:hypothetical protein